eukprot:TRINITY_DN160_c2_g1_i1.p1 TRINITY_DN160_c2_g1~~TRINITY_DN160_c2_g1_i1.p1  ORF type:complete len:177 (+),score=28.61 TRINITY_DN160_c2_g1_i1:89-619(+)
MTNVNMKSASNRSAHTFRDVPANDVTRERETFERLVHGTHIAEARSIMVEQEGIMCRPVVDLSFLGGDAAWMAGANSGHPRYGPVVLSASPSIVLANDVHLYFVEIIEYLNQAAVRILVSKTVRTDFPPYNPRVRGGPYFYDEETTRHSGWRTVVRRSDPPHWAEKAIPRDRKSVV